MKKLSTFILACCCALTVAAQESNHGKKLWAKSYLNRQAPAFHVDKWLFLQGVGFYLCNSPMVWQNGKVVIHNVHLLVRELQPVDEHALPLRVGV